MREALERKEKTMLNPIKNYPTPRQAEIACIGAEEMLANAFKVQARDKAYLRGLVYIPAPKHIFAVRFQRIEHFSVDVLARNADDAYAEAIAAFKANNGKVQTLNSTLEYFTIENLSNAKKG